MPSQLHAEVTWFLNFGHDLPYTQRFNITDPSLSYTYKAELDRQIPNPFYQYLTPDKFPGPLRNQRTVTVGSLLGPTRNAEHERYVSDIRPVHNAGTGESRAGDAVLASTPFVSGYRDISG